MYRIGLILGPAVFLAAVLEWILRLTHYIDLVEKTLPWTKQMSSPAGIWVTIIVGIVIFLAAWSERKKEKDQVKKPPELLPSLPLSFGNINQTASPVNTVDASQKLELHQHFQTAPPPVAVIHPSTNQLPKHHVKFINRKVTRLKPISEPFECFIECPNPAPNELTLKAFVANFRNERDADSMVADWDYVHAQIIYRGKYGEEIENVATACWVGTPKEFVHFERALVRGVIIAIQRGDGSWVAVSPEEVQSRSEMEMYDLKMVDLTTEVVQADVILHDSEGHSLKPERFPLELNFGAFGRG